NTKLYFTHEMYDGGEYRGEAIYQLEMDLPTLQQIRNSVKVIFVGSNELGAIQLGPDGSIYFCEYGSRWLGLIAHPNERGADCAYNRNGVMLGSNAADSMICHLGLPNIIDADGAPRDTAGAAAPHYTTLDQSLPNPSSGEVSISFSLGNSEPAS